MQVSWWLIRQQCKPHQPIFGAYYGRAEQTAFESFEKPSRFASSGVSMNLLYIVENVAGLCGVRRRATAWIYMAVLPSKGPT